MTRPRKRPDELPVAESEGGDGDICGNVDDEPRAAGDALMLRASHSDDTISSISAA